MGVRCDEIGSTLVKEEAAKDAVEGNGKDSRFSRMFYSNQFHNNQSVLDHYQGEAASVQYDRAPRIETLPK